jgi:Uma2 family endonuclease
MIGTALGEEIAAEQRAATPLTAWMMSRPLAATRGSVGCYALHMVQPAMRSHMRAEEYLAWEREQPTRHAFDSGDVFAMAGGSPRHNAICAAILRDLGAAVRGGDCRALTSDQRVGLRFRSKYVYPDVTVVCGRLALEEGTRDVVTNPRALFEVLSSSTEIHDRGDKWDGYRRLSSVHDYFLVAQRAVLVEHYQRQPDGSWRYTVVGAGESVTLESGARLDIDALYEGVFDLPGDEDDGEDSNEPAPER